MKKTILKIGLLLSTVNLIMAACSDYDSNDINSPTRINTDVSNKIRSYEDALRIAQASISMLNDSKTSTRGVSNTRKIDMSDKSIVKVDAKTRTNLNINDTLIYVFNFENNEGFALVSASKNTEGLIAITEKGHYVPDVRSENEGFNLFMEMAKQYIIKKGITEIDTTETLYGVDTVYVHNITGPYVSVKWGQDNPEGEFCPNNKSGCAATAMAQVMSYFEYPNSMSLTYYGHDLSNQYFNWSSMKAHAPEYPSGLPSCNSDTHKSISRLCRQLGERAGSSYLTGETSTRTDSIRPCMVYYGYQTSTNSYGNWAVFSENNIRNALDNGQLLFVKGMRRLENGSFGDGHIWVADGYDNLTTTIYAYSYKNGSDEITIDFVIGPTQNVYYHFNWGWYGSCNGYFTGTVFNSDNVTFPDTPNNSQGYYANVNVATLAVWK